MKLFFLLSAIILLCFSNSGAQEKLKSTGKIPILAWYSIPAGETSVARYQEMRDAGITHSLSFFDNADDAEKALDVAARSDVKIVLSCPELNKEPEKTVKRFMNHPALAGYHLRDEPAIQLFPELSDWAKKIQGMDPKHFCYVNLFPNFADSTQLGTKDYKKYVQEYIRQIPVQFVSFDYYPAMKDRIYKNWFENLEMISKESQKAGLPFWAFALTTNYDNDHVTPQSLAAMRLQVYADLAYGAQGIQYFTYWSATSVNSPSGEDQRGAPVSVTGKRSVVYDRIQQMSEEIQKLAGVFLGSKVVNVRHTGLGKIPAGTVRLTRLPEHIKVLETNKAPALVSVLENGENSFVVIVNTDHLNPMNLTVFGDETLKKVCKNGTVVPASTYDSTMEVDPGDLAIYMFPTNKK